jgi:selenocysteine-specific elongation factor
MTRSLILGTAGHIDHGKTELVKALTGVDTDRLKEEKERGITIDLGFARWGDQELQLGIVDVPGHEGFVRNMLAGATGMDVVLLVVAADEGIMPQTREHMAIASLLGVQEMVVALTKVDLVEEEWLELVREEVADFLADTPFADAAVVPTSARTGLGLEELGQMLRNAAGTTPTDDLGDEARLPVDRAFTVKGTGTVVTGTLWSGTLSVGQRVLLQPGGIEARIRGLQVHGEDAAEVRAGQRTAVALAGPRVQVDAVDRGQAVVASPEWDPSSILTVRAHLLEDSSWWLERNQRVRVHLGTAEVMARVVLLDRSEPLVPGDAGWVQLRLERPVVARARERLVLRSYSPVTTIGGGVVAEPFAPKRTRLDADTALLLARVVDGSASEAVSAVVALAGWAGARPERAPLTTGLPPGAVEAEIGALAVAGALLAPGAVFSAAVSARAEAAILDTVDTHHRDHPLRPGVPLDVLRAALPREAAPSLGDRTLKVLEERGVIRVRGGLASRPEFEPRPTEEQSAAKERLKDIYALAGLTPPAVEELPEAARKDPDLWPLLKLLEDEGAIVALDQDLFMGSDTLDQLVARVRADLGGRRDLGPADFRDVIPVTRKHLIPILRYLDGRGVTIRGGAGRDVPSA